MVTRHPLPEQAPRVSGRLELDLTTIDQAGALDFVTELRSVQRGLCVHVRVGSLEPLEGRVSDRFPGLFVDQLRNSGLRVEYHGSPRAVAAWMRSTRDLLEPSPKARPAGRRHLQVVQP